MPGRSLPWISERDGKRNRLAGVDRTVVVAGTIVDRHMCHIQIRHRERLAHAQMAAIAVADPAKRRYGSVAQAAISKASPDRLLVGTVVGGTVGVDQGVASIDHT